MYKITIRSYTSQAKLYFIDLFTKMWMCMYLNMKLFTYFFAHIHLLHSTFYMYNNTLFIIYFRVPWYSSSFTSTCVLLLLFILFIFPRMFLSCPIWTWKNTCNSNSKMCIIKVGDLFVFRRSSFIILHSPFFMFNIFAIYHKEMDRKNYVVAWCVQDDSIDFIMKRTFLWYPRHKTQDTSQVMEDRSHKHNRHLAERKTDNFTN